MCERTLGGKLVEETESSPGNTSKARPRNQLSLNRPWGMGGTCKVSEDGVLKTVRIGHLDIKSGIACKRTPTFSGCSIFL